MKFLVTGGCGFIGSHLVDELCRHGHEVIILDDLSTGKREYAHPYATLVVGDITDPNLVGSLLDGVHGCFHLAAIASVERSRLEWYSTHQVNVGGMVNLFDAIVKINRNIPVVYASSAAVYGMAGALPITEAKPPTPLSAYGVDKLFCEYHGRIAAEIHGISNIGLRFFNVYGPRQDPLSPYSGVISIFNHALCAGKGVNIYGDGNQSRDFVYVADVVRCAQTAMDKLLSHEISCDVLNVCTGIMTRIYDLVITMSDIVGMQPALQYKPSRPGDILISLGDYARLQRMLGITPQWSLKEGLQRTLSYRGGTDG